MDKDVPILSPFTTLLLFGIVLLLIGSILWIASLARMYYLKRRQGAEINLRSAFFDFVLILWIFIIIINLRELPPLIELPLKCLSILLNFLVIYGAIKRKFLLFQK